MGVVGRKREGGKKTGERETERERERKETVESGLCIFTLQISQVLLKGKTNLASGTRACSLCRVGSQPRRVEHRLSYQSYSICHNITKGLVYVLGKAEIRSVSLSPVRKANAEQVNVSTCSPATTELLIHLPDKCFLKHNVITHPSWC